jgi:hypothetical protein
MFGRLIDSSYRMLQRTAAIIYRRRRGSLDAVRHTSTPKTPEIVCCTTRYKVRRLFFRTTFAFILCELILLVLLSLVITKMSLSQAVSNVEVVAKQIAVKNKSAYADDENEESFGLKQLETHDMEKLRVPRADSD